MANQEQQQETLKMDHFSHKHPLTLVEIEDEEESKSEYYNRSLLRCYGCTEKIGSGVPYYCCEEGCPLFCLHHACAHLPTTIKRVHTLDGCDGDVLHLKEQLHQNYKYCSDCFKYWYRFAYVCSDCGLGVDIRCARTSPNEAKHSFHQHPVYPCVSPEADDLLCSVCSLIIRRPVNNMFCFYYKCNYCNFIVHPECTNVPIFFDSSADPHILNLDFLFRDYKICKICREGIDPRTQWAYHCLPCEYYIHAANGDCLTSTIRKSDLQHFDHEQLLALVEEVEAEEAPPTLDGTRNNAHSVAHEHCHCCRQKISYVPYYTCIHCNKYHLHQLCAHLPQEIEHPLQPKCPLKLFSGLSVVCDACQQYCNGFAYHCFSCDFDLDIECALRTHTVKKIFHKHPLFLSPTKAPYNCHACDKDTEGNSYQCTSCKFWVHDQCASLPMVKDKASHEHEHDLELIYTIPKKYSGVVVYCRICTKALKDHRWAYHCNRCRYLTHVHDCSNPHREGDGVIINASDVVNLPLAGEPILEVVLTNGKMTEHHRHPMILFADQLESNAIDITTSFMNLIRGSATWPTFRVNEKGYSGLTFSFYNNRLTLQITGGDLPHYIKHEAHPHVLESTFLNSSTWCHACEQFFFGRGFKCTTCTFTIDTYCALLPRIIKHRYDEHGFSLTYSAIEDVEEYVCEICEEDVIPKYFYHCVSCDQSIHARCIWQAYVRFDPHYKFGLYYRVSLVPPSEDLPQCVICHQKETFGHGFAFRWVRNYQTCMVHLTCISENDVHAC